MIWPPRPVLSKERVRENDELARDRGEGDLWLFADGDETAVEQFERWVEAGRGDGGHVQGFAHMSASASDVTRAIVFATFAGDRREARDHGGLLGRQGADLVQSGDQRDRGDRSDAGNRGENIKTPGENGIAGDQPLDLGIEVADRYLDSLELAFELQNQPLGLARAEAIKNGGPRGDGGIAAMHEFLQGLDAAGRRRGDA